MNNTFFTAARVARPAVRSRFFNSYAPILARTRTRTSPFRAIHFAGGILAGLTATALTTPVFTLHLDAPAGSHPLQTTKTIIEPPAGPAVVATGNSTIPTLPLTITINGIEHTLLGFGVRTVSFLSIQVYIGGFYVATSDLSKLSAALIKRINPAASTLLPSERELLQQHLLGAVESEELWNSLLKETGIRSAFRIAPVRDTDFHHLRDGFVRAIQARTRPGNRPDWVFQDEEFGAAMGEFRNLFNRGKVPKQKELLLARETAGVLRVLYDDGQTTNGRLDLGTVKDERVSRMLWLNWLGGKTVASEAARKSIAEGLLDLAARPVGTV